MSNNQHDNHADNIKTINEFLVDLIGALVPGAIFLFSIIISIIIPVMMIYFRDMHNIAVESKGYATTVDLLASNVFNGWFWLVLFFMFLILSYAIGNIFYRLDIKDVDKRSFRYQRKKLFKDKIKPVLEKSWCGRFTNIKKDKLDVFLKEYFELLFYHLKEHRRRNKQNWMENFKKLRDKKKDKKEDEKSIKKFTGILNEAAFLLHEKRILDALNLIEKKDKTNEPSSEDETNKSSIIAKKLLTQFVKPKDENDPDFLSLGWYFLFCLRSEFACDNDDDCQFPYEHYDTYLLKRDEFTLFNHAIKWCKDKDSRTKNALNTYKLKIQLKSKEVYNILVKNEAHIRMASSSYCVAKKVWWIAIFAMFIPLLLLPYELLFPLGEVFSKIWEVFSKKPIELIELIELIEPAKFAIVISLMPISIFFLSRFIIKSVTQFLHYQRLREIFFVLQVYDELEKQKNKILIE